jgi:hypothetical protein
MLASMARIGIVPGQSFDIKKLDASVQAALGDIPHTALRKIEANKDTLGEVTNGWVVTKGLGTYGTDYLKRAVVAAFGWPANQEKDAVYPYTETDSAGQKTVNSWSPGHRALWRCYDTHADWISGRARPMSLLHCKRRNAWQNWTASRSRRT